MRLFPVGRTCIMSETMSDGFLAALATDEWLVANPTTRKLIVILRVNRVSLNNYHPQQKKNVKTIVLAISMSAKSGRNSYMLWRPITLLPGHPTVGAAVFAPKRPWAIEFLMYVRNCRSMK